MPTVVSTTKLNPAESQLMDQHAGAKALASAQNQLATWQRRVAEAQAAVAAAGADCQATMAKILANHGPAVPVPPGATIARGKDGNGNDALIVSTP